MRIGQKISTRTITCCLALSISIFLYWWTYPAFSDRGTIKIYDRIGTLLYEQAGDTGSKHPVPYEAFPDHLIEAVVAAEDENFFSHWGVDAKRMLVALMDNIRARRIVSGASTITQQLARFSILSPNRTPRRTVVRKIREILMALRLSASYSKKEILTRYLNGVYVGNLSYGMQAAALSYFDTDVRSLSLAQSALLVGILSSPELRNPYTSLEHAKRGQRMVLERMLENGKISHEQFKTANSETLQFHTTAGERLAPHAVDFVLSQIENMDVPVNRGLSVYTTLDAGYSTLAQDVAKKWVRELHDTHDVSNAALVMVENKTGAIRVLLGGIDYTDATHSGQVNMATALRQPGSALKPITYAAAFAQGMTAATPIYDIPTVYKTKKAEGYAPHNYDGRFHGVVLAREALASSLNVPAVEMLSRIGIPTFLETARRLGISTFTEEDRYDLSLTLGGGEVTLSDLTTVYAAFARGGFLLPSYIIERVVDDRGHTVYTHVSHPGTAVFGQNSQQISYLISDMLSDPKARMMGFSEKNPLVLSHPAAVKTGTTTDWHDNWTVGYTPSVSVGVWVGNTDNHPMRQITGVVGAAPIWHQFMEEVLQGMPIESFERPDGIVSVDICTVDGKLAGDICPVRKSEHFLNGTQPSDESTSFAPIAIDIRNGLRATDDCPKIYTQTRVFLTYPQEVYSWAEANDMPQAPVRFSPLCSPSISPDGVPFLTITYPIEKAVFEHAPLLVSHQAIVFESAFSPDIVRVSWLVDNTQVGVSTSAPFTGNWNPVIGNHTISAIGTTANNTTVKSNTVHISVLEFARSAH